MGHYDGQEFQRMLQEAEANMLRGRPSLEVASVGDSLQIPGPPAALEDGVEKPEPFALPPQGQSQFS